MLLILARHGNTFGPHETPVWVGANEDPPLTEQGLEQSREIGRAIRDAGIGLDRILAGPLKRTRIGAELAAEVCGFTGEIEIDERLREIDYGVWGGKSDAEIAAEWGEAAINDWRERAIPPAGAGWSPSPAVLRENARAVFNAATFNQAEGDAVLIVTSNGVLRYFHPLLANCEASDESAKVKTGRMCAARVAPGEPVRLLSWNAEPAAAVLSPADAG